MDSSEVAPTEEAMKALLEYLVDPMLPLKASGKEPPLSTQQSVAKQMHAVVLLYNYYHRKQHPELQFLDFEPFCKLAVMLKPPLIAHMKYVRQTASSGLDDLENQLSITEKAIMEACNISKALDALKDVPSLEGWPVSKVSVLLVDSRKENCVLLFSLVTNGTWSVIEKSLDISNINPERQTVRKRKRTGRRAPRGEESTEELFFQTNAFSAVEEATGINRSELVVLECKVVYSLSKENSAACFYIMQCTQSKNRDFQVPIKDAIESFQEPLLKRISGSWILTPKVEYYSVLPYARIMSGWLSRGSNSLQILNASSVQRTEDNHQNKVAESEKVTSDGLHVSSVHLGSENLNKLQRPEKPSDGGVSENRDSNANYNSNKSLVAEYSGMREKEVEDRGKPLKCCDIASLNDSNQSSFHSPGKPCDGEVTEVRESNVNYNSKEPIVADSSGMAEKEVPSNISDLCSFQSPEKPCDGEVHENRESNINDNSKEAIVADNSGVTEKEVEDIGKPDKCCDITSSNVSDLRSIQSPEKPCDGEDHENRESNVNYNSKESIVADNSGMTEKEAALNFSDMSSFQSPEKPCDREVPENKESNVDYDSKEAIVADNSGMVEKEVPLNVGELRSFQSPERPCDGEVCENRESNINCNSKEAIVAGHSGMAEKEFENREKPGKCCDITDLNGSDLSTVVPETSKMLYVDNLHMSPNSSNKRLRTDMDSIGATCPVNGNKNKNLNTPVKVYHHQKRKISVESNALPSTVDISMKVETAKTVKLNNSEIEKGETVGTASKGNTYSTLNGTPAADCALAPLETNGKYVEKLHSTLAAKETEMTRTALRVLFRRRAKLCHQQREIEDEIALCDRDIQKVLDGNGDDSLALKLEAIIDCCNSSLKGKTKVHEEAHGHGDGQGTIQCVKGKRLSDAILTLQSPCQDLDDICRVNNWAFATYSISASDGGFLASVYVQGMDFGSSCGSALLSTPQAARESAAAQMMAKLRNMAGQT